MKSVKYIHSDKVHNIDTPNVLVPWLYDMFNPASVVDIGCGLGNFLHVFKQLGVSDILGVDGAWVKVEQRRQFLEDAEFIEHNLETEFDLKRKFDLVISLEVAEHLSPKAAKKFVENLTKAGDVILFSAAIPGQGGQNHINEQWLSYWQELFLNFDYHLYDLVRPIFWNDDRILWWYRQNMVVFSKKNLEHLGQSKVGLGVDVIHPELFKANIENQKRLKQKIDALLSGKKPFFHYVKLMVKSLVKKK